MSQLIESIRILNGRFYNLPMHELRANHSRNALFSIAKNINFRSQIIIPEEFKSGLVKCRVKFKQEIEEIDFQDYSIRKIQNIKVVQSNEIEYKHKFANRTDLDALYNLRDTNEEIMIVKNGLITDAYYYNYVFLKNKQFFTPKSPLLEGTMRNKLISNKRIEVMNIKVADLVNFDAVYLINAMTSLGQIKLTISQIIQSY